MTDDDASAFDRSGDADAPDDGRAVGADAEGTPAADGSAKDADTVDEDMQDVIEYDLADLAEDGEGAGDGENEAYPSMDDPVSPQSIDVENAAFVVLGVLAMVGLFLHLLLGVF